MSRGTGSLLPVLPSYWAFRTLGAPARAPLNFTLSLLYACNSRCMTCNVYERKVKIFSVDEYDKFLSTVGRVPYWFTLSGGEPFIRKDIVDIVKVVYDRCRPGIINIPHNGSFPDTTAGRVEEMAKACPESEIIINVSMDELGHRHDEIRGMEDNFIKATKTFESLKALGLPNLTVGIHTVISKFNVKNFPAIYKGLVAMNPDSYITEIAEERDELQTLGTGITPSAGEYGEAIDYLLSQVQQRRFNGFARIAQSFRLEYYKLARKSVAFKTQPIACYAGWASVQISPDGDVWPCCVRGESAGSLRDHDYDFHAIWSGERMNEIRRSIRNKECACPLANASYTNIMLSPTAMGKVGMNYLKLSAAALLNGKNGKNGKNGHNGHSEPAAKAKEDTELPS
jgi:MoaA/NifB/PqqE/SkfB family radical SAM enzyme